MIGTAPGHGHPGLADEQGTARPLVTGVAPQARGGDGEGLPLGHGGQVDLGVGHRRGAALVEPGVPHAAEHVGVVVVVDLAHHVALCGEQGHAGPVAPGDLLHGLVQAGLGAFRLEVLQLVHQIVGPAPHQVAGAPAQAGVRQVAQEDHEGGRHDDEHHERDGAQAQRPWPHDATGPLQGAGTVAHGGGSLQR